MKAAPFYVAFMQIKSSAYGYFDLHFIYLHFFAETQNYCEFGQERKLYYVLNSEKLEIAKIGQKSLK